MIEEKSEDTIQQIEQNYLFILTHTEIAIVTTCSKNTGRKNLKGIALIYFENCTITINNMQYSSKYATFWDSVEIVSTIYNEINTTVKATNLTLEKLNKWTTRNSEAIKLLNLQSNNNYISIIGTIIVILPTIIVIIIAIRSIQKKRQAGLPPDSPSTNIPQPTHLSWASLHS